MEKEAGRILIDWCPSCGHTRTEHGINGCRSCDCPKQSSQEQQHRDESQRERERNAGKS
jgi:hypothetical protein